MQIIQDIHEWMNIRKQLPSASSLGFVPTMGNLHKGHVSLYQQSMLDNDITIASLFINPTQFDRIDDFKSYPRTVDDDLELLTKTGVDYCILPTKEDIYADGYRFQVQENIQSLSLEGKHRAGHFNGVLTVVMKLLNIAKPHRAYFGEKDYQQYELIRDMAKAFMMDIEIKACPTIREQSGLAFSSRNNRLTVEQRNIADQFASIFHQNNPCCEIINELIRLGIDVDYIKEHNTRRYAAVRIGDIRLIDNYAVSST